MKNWKNWLIASPALVYIAVFTIITMVTIFSLSFGLIKMIGPYEGFTFRFWRTAFTRESFDSLFFSVRMGLYGSLFTVAVAFPLALLLNQPIKGIRAFGSVIKTPFFVPAIVAAFLIVNLISYHGFINEIFLRIGIFKEPQRMLNDKNGIAVVVIQVWKNTPFALMIMTSAIAAIRKDVIEAAYNLGATRWRVFVSVYTPLCVPAILTTVIILFIKIFGDFPITSIAGPDYPRSLANTMQIRVQMHQEWEIAGVLAILLIAMVLLVSVAFTLISRLVTLHYEKAPSP